MEEDDVHYASRTKDNDSGYEVYDSDGGSRG